MAIRNNMPYRQRTMYAHRYLHEKWVRGSNHCHIFPVADTVVLPSCERLQFSYKHDKITGYSPEAIKDLK